MKRIASGIHDDSELFICICVEVFICVCGGGGLLYIYEHLLKLQDSRGKETNKEWVKERSFRKETDVRDNVFSVWYSVHLVPSIWEKVELCFPSK